MSIGAGAGGEGDDLALVAPDVDPGRLADYELVADMREFQVMQAQMYAADLEAVARWAGGATTCTGSTPRPGNAAAARCCTGSGCSAAVSTRASPSWSSRAPPRPC